MREELESIREAIPRETKFHRVIYGEKNVAIDSYGTFMAQTKWEKKNHPSPGKVPADAIKKVGDADGGAKTDADDGAGAQVDPSIAHLPQAEQDAVLALRDAPAGVHAATRRVTTAYCAGRSAAFAHPGAPRGILSGAS